MRDMRIAANRPKIRGQKLTCNYVDSRSGSCCSEPRLDNTGYCAGHQGSMPLGLISSGNVIPLVATPIPSIRKGRGWRLFEF